MLASTQCMGRQPFVLGIVSSIVTPKESRSWTYHAEESPLDEVQSEKYDSTARSICQRPTGRLGASVARRSSSCTRS